MKTIKSLKDITTLEVGDKVVFGNLEYKVIQSASYCKRYYLMLNPLDNDKIFRVLNIIDKEDFVDKLGIKTAGGCFPETYSLEALTALVSALFKEYERQRYKLPKTWEEFCEEHKVKEGECYIDSLSNIQKYSSTPLRGNFRDKNICTSESEAEAFLALMQLRQLRKAYVKDWEPDWTESSDKYCIHSYACEFEINSYRRIPHVLSFPTKELAQQFLTNFRNLLEIAKPLL